MKNILSLVLVLSATSILPSALAEEPAVPAPVRDSVGLAVIGQVNTNLVTRVQKHLQSNLGITVNLYAKPLVITGENLKDAMGHLAQAKGPRDLCLLALVNVSGDSGVYMHISAADGTGVLDIRRLIPAGMGEVPTEQYIRRVDKEAMRVVGLLLGMPPCPFPQCCLSDWANENELDQKGRNFCPPCHGRFGTLMKGKGVETAF